MPGDGLGDTLSMKREEETDTELAGVSFRWLLQSAPDGIVIVDAEGRIILVNNQAEKLFGYSENELVGKPIETLIPERFRAEHVSDRADYASRPRTRPMGTGLELYGVRRNNEEFPVEISLSPVRTEHGLVVMAIVRDVTDFKREHYISTTLQSALLSVIPERMCGLQMACEYHSAYAGAQVGGDFFDAFSIGQDSVGIVIGDVSGKGVGASVRTALGKYSLRAYAYENPEPSSVMRRLNTAVYNQVESEGFITLFYGLIDTAAGTISYSNSGHMPPLYLNHSTGEAGELKGGGVPLGVIPGADFEQYSRSFTSGDRVLLYTDGTTDARDGKGFFGLENLISAFVSGQHEPPAVFTRQLIRRLEEWSDAHLHDDIALLLVSAG